MMRFASAAALTCVAMIGVGHAAQGNAASAPSRYRAAIAALLQLKPGMVAAEVGSTPGVIGSEMTPLVGPGGRVISATLDRKTASTNLEPASVDAVALITVFGVVDRHKDLLERIAAALKPGGALLVVDVPQENDGRKVVGIEAEDVVRLAAAAGLKREAESGIVPGHYAIRFRKP
jgi:predicted methyltransferase